MQPAHTTAIPDSLGEPAGTTATASRPGHTMVRKLADIVVLPESQLSNNERDFVADLLIRAMENVEPSIREDVAVRLVGFIDIPVQLQRVLMLDDMAVARHLLEHLTDIPETLLLEVSQRGYDYRQIIATRDRLPQSVVDRILSYGESDLIVRLLKRPDLEISYAAMDGLVARSEVEEGIRPHLVRRPELRLEHGLRMFWWLKSPLRKAILSRFAINRSIIQESMHSLFVEIFTGRSHDDHVKGILKLIDRRHRPRGRNGEVVTMDIVVRTLKLARQTPTDEFCHAVGLLAGVSTDTAGRALRDLSGEAFAILCKSIGISRSAFFGLFGNEDEAAAVTPQYSPEKLDDLMGVFDSIARDYSRTILRYWDWRQDLYTLAETNPASLQVDKSGSGNTYFGAI